MEHFPLTRAVQLTISKDRSGIGLALHMGRGCLLSQGIPTAGLYCRVGKTHGVKHWQRTHTLTLLHGLPIPHEYTMAEKVVCEVYTPIAFDSFSLDYSLDTINGPSTQHFESISGL